MAREPITWKNIGIPNTNAASTLLNSSQANLSGAMGTLNKFFDDQQKLQSQNRDRMVDLNTQEATNLLRQYQTVDDYQNALQSGDLDRQLAQFGPLIDQQRVNALRDSRLTDLRNTANAQYEYENTLADRKERPIFNDINEAIALKQFDRAQELALKSGLRNNADALNNIRTARAAYDEEQRGKVTNNLFRTAVNNATELAQRQNKEVSDYFKRNNIPVKDNGEIDDTNLTADQIEKIQGDVSRISQQYSIANIRNNLYNQYDALGGKPEEFGSLMSNFDKTVESLMRGSAYEQQKRQEEEALITQRWDAQAATRKQEYEDAVRANPFILGAPEDPVASANELIDSVVPKGEQLGNGAKWWALKLNGDAPGEFRQAVVDAMAGKLKGVEIAVPKSIVEGVLKETSNLGKDAFVSALQRTMASDSTQALIDQASKQGTSVKDAYLADIAGYEQLKQTSLSNLRKQYGDFNDTRNLSEKLRESLLKKRASEQQAETPSNSPKPEETSSSSPQAASNSAAVSGVDALNKKIAIEQAKNTVGGKVGEVLLENYKPRKASRSGIDAANARQFDLSDYLKNELLRTYNSGELRSLENNPLMALPTVVSGVADFFNNAKNANQTLTKEEFEAAMREMQRLQNK